MVATQTTKSGGARFVWLDNLKGIAIILMVLGHSGAPFTHWIFLFHMAVFYIASGYFWKDKHILSSQTYGKYICNKVKTLYFPYVICNLIFLVLNNFLIDSYIYASSLDYLDLINSNDMSLLHEKLSLEQFAIQAGSICALKVGTELGGPTWFFASLFLTLVLFSTLRFVLNVFFNNKVLISSIEVLVALVFLLIAWAISENRVSLPIIKRVFEAYPLIVVGGWIRRLDDVWICRKTSLIFVAIITMIILLTMNQYGSISMARCKIENPLFFLIVSLSGWFLLASISKLYPLKAVAKLGAGTRSIVMWHFISMKSVTWAYIIVVGLPVVLLGAFPYLQQSPSYLWIVYTIVGVGIPYLLGVLYDSVKTKIKYDYKI